MEDLLFYTLFGLYPYICILVLIIGSIYRITLSPYSLSAKSSQILENSKLFLFNIVLFHVSILVILAGHFVGFLTPSTIWQALHITNESHAEMAHIIGGIAAVCLFIAMIGLLIRRFGNAKVSASSCWGDKAILVYLLIQLILGMLTIFIASPSYLSDGDKIVLYNDYFYGIFTAHPSAYFYLVSNVSTISLIHVFMGWSLFLLLPFTRLLHLIFAPLVYLVRTGYQIVRKA